MKTMAALLLGLALLAAQALHGGAFVPALAWPAYGLLTLAAVAAIIVGFRNPSPPAPWALLTAATVAGVLICRAMADGNATLARIDATSIAAGALAFFIAATLPDAKTRILFLSVLLVGVIGQSAIGVRQKMSAGEFSSPHWFSMALQELYGGKFVARVRGTFLNPNQLAWFVGAMAIFCSTLTVWGRVSISLRFVFGFFALVCIAIDVLTASRGGLVSLAVGFGVVLVGSVAAAIALSRRVAGGGGILLGSIAALVVAGLGAVAAISGSWTAQGRMESFTYEGDVRSLLLDQGLRAFQEAPTVGHGPGSFVYLARLFREGRHQAGDAVFAHNDWLQLLVEYGFWVFAIFAIGLAIVIGGGAMRFARVVTEIQENRMQAASNTAAILLGALAVAVAMILQSVLDFNMRIPANLLLAGVVLGFLTNPDSRVLRSAGRIQFARIVSVVMLVVFGAGLGWAVQRFSKADWLELTADNARIDRSWAKAAAAAAAGLGADPDNPRLLLVMARTQFARAMGGAHRDAYGRAQILQIDEPEAEEGLDAESAAALARSRNAYERLLVLSAREREVFAEFGRVLVRDGDGERAETLSIQAVERDPRHGYSFVALGDMFLDRGQYENARQAYYVGATVPGDGLNWTKFQAVEEILERNRVEESEAVAE